MTTSRQERWRAVLSVLGNRDFFFVWISGGLVTMSKAVRTVAVMKLIYDLTGLAAGVGILVGSDILAGVLILPLAGVLADRFDRRRMQIIIDVLRAVLALTIMWSRSALIVYLLSFALFILTNCYFPARSAIVPDVVKREQLLDANAASKSLSTLGKVVGPLIGGFVVARFSLNSAFILCAALYLVSAVSMLLVRTRPLSLLRAEASVRAVYEEFVDGIRYARQNPVVSVVTTIYLTLLIGWGLSLSLDVVFAEQVLASDTLSTSQAYSYLTSAAAFGMFLGALVVTYLGRRFAKKWLWLFGLGVMSLDGLGLAIVSSLSLSLAAKFAHGIGEGLMWSLWPTILQENVEKDKRGRVFGLFVATASIPAVVTAYLGGILADYTSVRVVYGITCVWILLTVIGGSFLPKFRAIPVRIPGKESKQEAKA